MRPCPKCRRELPEIYRYCTVCGSPLDPSIVQHRPNFVVSAEALNLQVLYGMAAVLVLAVLFPPWETPPTQAPEFLGLHFILTPPTADAVVSRLLMTIELVTIAIAGLYGAFLFRQR
jgi:zinc ribbon protein